MINQGNLLKIEYTLRWILSKAYLGQYKSMAKNI